LNAIATMQSEIERAINSDIGFEAMILCQLK